MNTTAAKLAELLEGVPDDLVDYFEHFDSVAALRGHYEVEVHPLTLDQSLRMTREFRKFHPVVSALGGVILDDPNTSNHHLYLSKSPCEGTVLFLDHDGDSRIVFPTLTAFVEASQKSIASREDLQSAHPKCAVLISDQAALSRLIVDLYEGGLERDGTSVLLPLIPSMDLIDVPLLQRLAVDPDMYIAEAIGDAISCRPRMDLKSLADLCKNHSHPQASRAGSRALAAIGANSKQ